MSSGLAIVGYGKMGRLIEQLAPEYGFDVRAKFSRENNLHDSGISQESLRGIDVAVEFTTPDSAPDNLRRLASLGINTVCGTTGWFEHLSAVHKAIPSAGTGLVYSANFSVGVNVFLQTVARAAGFFAKYPEYEAWGWEIHHSAKKDAPSGTLKKLAEEIRAAGYQRTLTLTANRAGAHPGTHEIGFDSAADTITLRHTARSREGFARGALQAARWVHGKKGVFEFREILSEIC
jgi:4-hydroxy-tetrahydrodipicolinate reductase